MTQEVDNSTKGRFRIEEWILSGRKEISDFHPSTVDTDDD